MSVRRIISPIQMNRGMAANSHELALRNRIFPRIAPMRCAGKSRTRNKPLVDTNSSPEGVDYIIPGNDDAIRGVGAASLCLGARVAGLHLTGVERDAPTAALARRNAQEICE